jgi:hypothetical protein
MKSVGRNFSCGITAALTILLLWSAVPASGAGESFVLAILRRDSIAIPFAVFSEGKWKASWPADTPWLSNIAGSQQVPAEEVSRWWGLDPPPKKFWLWDNGVRKREVNAGNLAVIPVLCARRFAFRTDYTTTSPLPPAKLQEPYPKEGLLVSGTQQTMPVESVAPDDPARKKITVQMHPEFNHAEDEAVKNFTEWVHPVPQPTRWLTPVVIEALYRAPMDTAGWTSYYVEAVRAYPPGIGDRGCGLETTARGWVRMSDKGEFKINLGARVSYCDRKDVSYMLPFGVLRADDKIWWIHQISGYEVEWYTVTRVTPKDIETPVSYFAGADCRSLPRYR